MGKDMRKNGKVSGPAIPNKSGKSQPKGLTTTRKDTK